MARRPRLVRRKANPPVANRGRIGRRARPRVGERIGLCVKAAIARRARVAKVALAAIERLPDHAPVADTAIVPVAIVKVATVQAATGDAPSDAPKCSAISNWKS